MLELTKDQRTEGSILHYLGTMNFLTFGAWFFFLCVVIAIVASLTSPALSFEKLKGLTFATLTPEHKKSNREGYNWVDIALSIVIVGIVIAIMIFFNGR